MGDQQESSKKAQESEQNIAGVGDQLDDEYDDDDGWGGKSDSNSNSSNSDGSKTSSRDPSDHSNGNEQFLQQLNDLQAKNDQLKAEKDRLEADKVRLEAENDQLKRQLESRNNPTDFKPCNIPPRVANFIEEHQDDITFEFLVKTHEALLQLRAMNPDGDFGEYLINTAREVENLKQSKRTLEKKLQLMKKCYEEELTQAKVLKNSGGREYMEYAKKRDKTNRDSINILKEEVEHHRREVDDIREKNDRLEKKSFECSKNLKAAQNRITQLEAALRRSANLDKSHMGRLSSSSSFAEAPPPPPFNADTLNEIQGIFPTNQQMPPPPNSFNNLSMDHSIPSPPPPPPPRDIDVPMSEILESVRSHLNVRDNIK